MKQLIEHRLEVAEHNLDEVSGQDRIDFELANSIQIRIQELKDILKELERVEIKPEPQPIENLFELEEDTSVWLKGYYNLIEYAYFYHGDKVLFWGECELSKEVSEELFQSFLIAEAPKF